MHLIRKKIIPVIILFSMIAGQSYALTGREVMEFSDSLPKAETSSNKVSMRIFKAGKTVEKKFSMEMITLDTLERRSLINFERPSSLKLLTYSRVNREDYQWLAMSSGRVKRITDAVKGKSFVNSHFAYEDLAVKNLDDYSYRLLGETLVGSEICYRVECIEKVKSSEFYRSVYSKTIVYSRKKDGFIVKIDFYENNKFIKYLVNYDVESVSGILTPMRVVMYDAVTEDRTELVMIKAENNINVLRSKFNREAIRYNE